MHQKVGNAGGLSFPVGGKIIDEASTNYVYPKIAFDHENTVCFFSTVTNTIAIGAQCITLDHEFNWTDTKILCDAYTKWNYYQDYVVLNSTDDDCNAIFWAAPDGNIYGASTCKIEDVVALQSGTLYVQNFDTRNKISWKTYNQAAGDKYEVQRSINGIDFTTLSTIPANVTQSDYIFWDENPVAGINYYKVKLINTDGRIEFSNIVSAKVKAFILEMKAYPNPVKNILQIMLSNLPAQNAHLTIYNLEGKIIKSMPVTTKTFSINMTGFAKGNYYLKYKDDSHSEQIKIFKD